MHEILFRGKRVDNGEWVEGCLAAYDLICPNYPEDTSNATGDYYGQTPYVGFAEVDPSTVGQFTGLTDKNGKRIYEGDVVLYPWNYQDKTKRFTIKFKDGQFVASPIKKTEDYWDFMVGGYSKEMEIIGNVHDNPELLDGGAE